ncbi:MAG: virulence RhuM family protein [Bifidobacteriaceae bacterium]|jgi:hypothetical protein|nr:virulence RhuM family protein [Bifidobacteriaceae bacterium]
MDKIVIYDGGKNGKVKIDVNFENETVWLTQKKMAELYNVSKSTISEHIKNIFDSGELDESSVSSKMEHTANDNKIYNTTFYNLDAIISVGYRVNSKEAMEKAYLETIKNIEKKNK